MGLLIMNKAYRLVWNHRLNAWIVASELARGCGKSGSGRRRAGLAAALIAIAAGQPLAAADLAPGALPTGGTIAAGQASIATSGTRMDITQGSRSAIINWQGFDIGSQVQVNFAQPNASAVALNRVSGPNISRIEGHLTANGQVFLVNPNGMLFGVGARVNAGAFVASTLNIRDADFLNGNYSFSGSGGAIENRGSITAAPGGYVAFIAPQITNAGTVSAPQGTVAMGAGERVTLNFAGDRLVGLSVAADTLDALIDNRQAIRAEGGAILLTAAGAEAVTRSVINNAGVLEASSLTSDGGRIVLTAGNDINLGAGSAVAVDGKNGGEITVQAKAGTLLAEGSVSARGAEGNGGTGQLLGYQVGLVNAAQVDASGATGGGTVNIGGSQQGAGPLASSRAVFIGEDARVDASATNNGNGGTVIVYADEAARIYGHLSARGGAQGGNGGFIETSGKQYLDVLRTPDATALAGRGGEWLIDPNNILIVTAAGTCANLLGCAPGPNWATTNDSAQLGVNLINNALNTGQSVTVTTTTNGANTQPGNITFQAGANIAKTAGGDATVTLSAHNDINTTGVTIGATTGRLNVVLTADSDSSGAGSVVVGGNVTTRGGSFTATGAGISGAGTINTTGGANVNGGNIAITGTSAAGSINLTGAMTTTGGAAAAGTAGRTAGNVTITGAGAVTVGAITANGSIGNGAGQAGGNGGAISVTSNGTLSTGNLAASGGNGVATAAGGNAGTIAASNNSTTSGTLTTGTLTVRAGAAAGAIVSGAAGSVNVTNRAATLLRTGAINTSGQAGGAGGDVALTSAGGVTTSTIATSGGTLNATTAAAGRNAGNVTIKGVNRSIAGAITASGGAAIVAGQAGGAGGNVLITGTDGTIATAGTLSTTGITARSGNALGTVTSGTAGSIALEATQISATGALTTTGGADGAGGNIALTSTGTLSINGAIAASGGTANASSAGRNAGNVTISGAGITSTAAGTITASGSGAATAGSNQAGGAGGAIQISSTNGITLGAAVAASGGAATTTNANGGNAGGIAINNSGSGNISTTTLTASTGAATGTGAGGNAGFVSVTNAAANGNLTTRAITTTGGAKGNGGNVTLSALGAVSTANSNITTTGGAGIGGAGRNAGTITISGGGVNLGTGIVTANGGAGNGANQAGGNGGNVSITGTANTVAVGAISTIGGNGGTGTGTANGGNAGTITLDAGGATPSITLGGNLTATGGNRAGASVAGSGGQIWLKDAVLLNAAAITASAQGGSAGVGAGANVRFDGTINSTGGTRALTVNTNAGTIFAGAVGGTSALASLTTNAGGTTSIGGNVTTTTTQTYNDAVTLTGNAVLTGTTPTFASTVAGGGFDLTLNFSGTTTVNGANFTGIGNLATGNGGTTQLTGAITTTGTQTYNDAVTLTGATTLASSGNGAISLNGTVNGAQTLAVNVTGTTTFAGAVGGTTPLTSLTTNAGGTTNVGGNVTTTGTQTYNDAVTLTGVGTRTFASTGNNALAFNATVDGASALVANTTGTTTFAGAVGGTTALTSLTTNADGTTAINGGSVRTTGNQTYSDNVSLGAPTTLVTTANGDITANGSVAANGHLLTLATGLGNVVMQNAANDFATVSVASATNVALRDTNAIDLGASTIGANLTLTSGGAVTDSGAVSVAGATTINAGASNDVTLDNANDFGSNVSVQSGRNVRLNDISNLTLDLSTFGTLTATAAGTVTLAGQLTASGAGDAIVLSGGRFVNSAGASALSVPAGSRWLVWSNNPSPFGGATPDNRGSLAYDFKQYNATYPTTTVLGSGNGFLYALAPAVTPALTGTVTKVYDATTSAPLVAANFTSTSGVDGDVVAMSGTGTYDNANVAGSPTKLVIANGIAATVTSSVADGSKPVYGYTLTSTTASANIGEITPAPLTITGTTGSSTYTAVAQTNTFSTSGLLTGNGDSVTGVSTLGSGTNVGTYADNLTSASGTGLSNYAISYVNGSLTITPAALTVTANDAQRPVNTLNPPFSATYVGFVGGETPAVLNGALVFSTPATVESPAGPYPITPFGQTSSNYRISYLDGVLDVIAVPVGPTVVLGLPFDPQAVAAEYSEQSRALGTVPAVRYVEDHEVSDTEAPGSRVRVVAGGLKVGR
jgi:filamentous hemagglutinin family protein